MFRGVREGAREFTEFVAAAIANTESRSELAASRARIVAASDETRRRVERDLHDGVQQRLVSLALEVRVPLDGESRYSLLHARARLQESAPARNRL